jgi:hypothetical protein
MVCIEKFLGQRVEIPEDRRYEVKQGLWAKGEGKDVLFGVTQPALGLIAHIKSLSAVRPAPSLHLPCALRPSYRT